MSALTVTGVSNGGGHTAGVTDAAEGIASRCHIGRDEAIGGTLGEANLSADRRLVLLVDHDVANRRHARHLLELHGLEVVQVSNGIAALELIQRLPQSFGLVIAEMDLPGITGAVLLETLRIFRPNLPAICMSERAISGVYDGRRCLRKPLSGPDLSAALQEGPGSWEQDGAQCLPETLAARARARYAVVGDLVEAARELSRAPEQED